MYTEFFGLKKRPFVLSPDPEFLYFSREHDLAFTHLEYGLVHKAGFVALTGEVGSGKTTLLKYLLEKVHASVNVAMVFNTGVDPRTLLEMLVKEFELKPPSLRTSDLFDTLYEYFLNEYAKGRRCVIVVDEAQNLSLKAFEELRMLSNLDAGNEFLVQILLAGQPQLRKRLSRPELAQLTQRISVHYHLSPLQSDEVGKYIEHRIRVAGYSRPEPLFSEEAMSLAAGLSQGVPRVINSICDASCTYAFADRAAQISREIVEKVVEDNELLLAGLKPCEAALTAASATHLDGPDEAADRGEDILAAEADGERGRSSSNGSDAAYSKVMLSHLLERMSAFEKELRAADAEERYRSVALLQEMLAKERERCFHAERKLAHMAQKYKTALTELEEARNRLAALDSGGHTATEQKKTWRRFWS